FLSEAASKEILSAYGRPVNSTKTATTEKEAVSMSREIGFPVALKLMSPDISHKTDAHGVHLNLQSDEAVRNAFYKIMKDRALGLPPLNLLLAQRVMEDIRAFTLLKGIRNRPPADMEALEALLMRIFQLVIDFSPDY
ncbi:MAG: acetate--CoA ligase family protein, partial [Desulfotignum sp.]